MPGSAAGTARWSTLALIAFICAAISVALWSYRGAVAAEAVEAAALAVACGLAALWLLRSFAVAVLVAGVPLVAALLSFAVLVPLAAAMPIFCDVLIPHAVATALLPGACAGLVMGYGFTTDFCSGMDMDAAGWHAARRLRRAVVLTLAVVTLWRALLVLPDRLLGTAHAAAAVDYSAVGTAVAALFVGLTTLVLFPFVIGALRPGEDAIADANRLRESRERRLEVLARAATPRWAVSVLGIVIVIGAIAFFGTPPLVGMWRAQGLLFPATLLVAGLAGAVGARDWRGFFTVGLAVGFSATLIAAWAPGGASLGFGNLWLSWNGGGAILPVSAALCAGPCILMAARIAAHRTFDDPLSVAFTLALREVALPLLAFAIVLALVAIRSGLWLAPLLSTVTALLLTPALAAVFELVFAKTRSVEEIYGRARQQ